MPIMQRMLPVPGLRLLGRVGGELVVAVHRRLSGTGCPGSVRHRPGVLGVVHRVLAPEHLALWLNDPAEPATRPTPGTDGPRSDQMPEARL